MFRIPCRTDVPENWQNAIKPMQYANGLARKTDYMCAIDLSPGNMRNIASNAVASSSTYSIELGREHSSSLPLNLLGGHSNDVRKKSKLAKVVFESDDIIIKHEPGSTEDASPSDEAPCVPSPAPPDCDADVDPLAFLAPFAQDTDETATPDARMAECVVLAPAPKPVVEKRSAPPKAPAEAPAEVPAADSITSPQALLGRIRPRKCLQQTKKRFVCECGEAFVHGSSLRIHRLTHTGEPRFGCETCGKALTTGRGLRIHRLTHADVRPTSGESHACDQCPKECSNAGLLRRHKLVHAAVRRFACDECDASFAQRTHLRHHKDSHMGVRRHACTQCDRAFVRKGELVKHRKIHEGATRERTHTCDICGKSFYQVGHLSSHAATHSGIRPFKCPQCPLAFSRNSFLTSHARTHIDRRTKPRPFGCTECTSTFARRCDLTKHALLHTGERRYVCDACGKAFSQSGHLASHKAVHTGERPHVCAVCGKAFKRRTALRRHQMTPQVHGL